MYHNIPSLFARSLLIRESLGESSQTIIITDGYETCKKLSKHLLDTSNTRAQIIDHPGIYKELILQVSGVYLATVDVFFQEVPDSKHIVNWTRHLKVGETHELEQLITWLTENGYHHDKDDSPHTYHTEGDVLHIIQGDNTHIRVSFFGSQIDEIYINRGNDQPVHIDEIIIRAHFLRTTGDEWHVSGELDLSLYEMLDDANWWLLGVDFWEHSHELFEKFSDAYIINDLPTPSGTALPYEDVHIHDLQELKEFLLTPEQSVICYTKNPGAIERFLQENEIKEVEVHELRKLPGESFVWTSVQTGLGIQPLKSQTGLRQVVLSDDILAKLFIKKRSRLRTKQRLDLLIQIKPGDHIVHLYHGVGIFRQFIKKDLSGVTREYLEIEYAGEDKLFVPIEEVYRVSKYIGQDKPTLTRLGKLEWKKTLAKTQKEIEDIADQLIEDHATRQLSKGFAFDVFEDKERAFHEAFPYPHTLDQESAIEDIFADMASDNSMDRLLSGDVGFGKTEVAFHAIYRAFLNAKQTLLLTPLVVLAYEHFEACKQRLEPFGIKVDILTRLSTGKEVRQTLQKLKEGSVHVVVGTHRLLSSDIDCFNLGLMVVDEEHKFGVKDKERILNMKTGVDTLAMSATPIPRSLNLALSGVKQFSILGTPPKGKEPISTLVTPYDPDTVKKAVIEELDRGGKIFYIYNRVETILSMQQSLEKILGKRAKIIITHGQMDGVELEDNIIDFKSGKYNILLTTTVIENGINFLDTNTIIIHDAQQFGLAQLHQLRGRVGRGKIHGYCYLMYGRQNLADDAKERLVTIANNTHLGAGFEIAMRDMEMRGVGEILGVKQSGKTKDVGISFYLKLLEQKIEELKAGKTEPDIDCKIELGISYFVPDDFFSSDMDKIHFYRHLESVDSSEELQYLYERTVEEHDDVPIELENLFLLSRARLLFRSWGMISVKKQLGNYTFIFDKGNDQNKLRKFLNTDHQKHIILVSTEKAQIREKAFGSAIAMLEYFVN